MSGQVKHFPAYEQGYSKKGNLESRFHRETLNLGTLTFNPHYAVEVRKVLTKTCK